MQVLTRSRRIRKALRVVQSYIPSDNWTVITSFLTWIRVDAGWQTSCLGEAVNPTSAELLPLYDLQDPKRVAGSQIRFVLPLCRLYSDRALIGLVAHELAHAVRAAKLGQNWLQKMGGEHSARGADRRYKREERQADGIASGWGFAKEIRAMREERESVLNPYLATHEIRILRQIRRSLQ